MKTIKWFVADKTLSPLMVGMNNQNMLFANLCKNFAAIIQRATK